MEDRTHFSATRLTPEQFRAVVVARGWTYKELAHRWGVSSVWVSNLARNPDRPSHYDDAILGLPPRRFLVRNERRRRAWVEALVLRARGERKAAGGFRYHGYLVPGAIVTAVDDLGSVAEAGMRGVVFQVADRGNREAYGVIFESGLWDWFEPEHIDKYLAETGLSDPGLKGSRPGSNAQLEADFKAGRFDFWPG